MRLTAPYKQITKVQDVDWPSKEALMFRNHLAGILDAKDVVQYNFVLTNETSSNTSADTELHQVMIKKESCPVKRIVIWYDQHMALLRGI